jgi:hypothetical protein
MSKKMSECVDILDDMVKSLTFDPAKPYEMGAFSPHYSPYKHIAGTNGGFMPHSSKYWAGQNKRYQREEYMDQYRRNDSFGKSESFEETNEVTEALDFLTKGGPGSGRHGKDPHSHLSPAFLASQKADQKMKEKKETPSDDKKKRDEDHAKEVARLVSYMKSEDNEMSKENDIMKSLGFTVGNVEEMNLIQSVEENTDVVKSIENNDFHIGSKAGLNKSFGDENLKNTHGEKFHKDNDKDVEKKVTKIDEVKYPKEGEMPKSRKLDTESQKSLGDTINDLIKGEKKEEKAKAKVAEGVDDMIDAEVKEHEDDMHKKSLVEVLNDLSKAEAPDMRTKEEKARDEGEEAPEPEAQLDDEGNEMDEAEVEAAKEIKDNEQVGADAVKSENILADLVKACGGGDAIEEMQAGDLDKMQADAHKKSKKVKKKDIKVMHENSEEV